MYSESQHSAHLTFIKTQEKLLQIQTQDLVCAKRMGWHTPLRGRNFIFSNFLAISDYYNVNNIHNNNN